MPDKKHINILDIKRHENEWEPPEIPACDMAFSVGNDRNAEQSNEYFHIFEIEAYIDSIYIHFSNDRTPDEIRRFVFKEGYYWTEEEEAYFAEKCLKNSYCGFSGGALDRIFSLYADRHPEWHLHRYYAKGLRILDHIYNCMRKNTAKEILYKAGLVELVDCVDGIDELNMFESSQTELYDGLSIRVLRSLNCKEGALLLNSRQARLMIRDVNVRFPDLFKDELNDAQCRYLAMLIRGDLVAGEVGRLFGSRKKDLGSMWCSSMFEFYMHADRRKQAEEESERVFAEKCRLLTQIDPIYEKSLKNKDRFKRDSNLKWLEYFLLQNREKYDREVRRSNRKRDQEWQERGKEYIVRYPQTINDFCREAMYMQNCLDTYIEAFIKNDTTILFMRESGNVNKPFITIEIYDNVLMQAYHRFNKDCSREEAAWIRQYCARHKIDPGRFSFDSAVDELF